MKEGPVRPASTWKEIKRPDSDTAEMLPVIEQAVAYMREAGIAKSRFWAYLLVQDVEDAKNRAIALSMMGVEPFAHWVNKKSVFHSCTWEEFKKE